MIRLIMLTVSLIFTTEAYAISQMTRFSCASDYLKYCFPAIIGSKEVDDCFRRVGKDLQPDCIAALKEDGLITEEDKAKAVEEPEEPKKEEVPVVVEPPKEEPLIIGDKPKTDPTTVKSSVLQNIAKKVAAKLRDTGTKVKNFYYSTRDRYVSAPVRVGDKKLQQGGKWDGFPLYLEWNSNRKHLGGELTPYGLEDRK